MFPQAEDHRPFRSTTDGRSIKGESPRSQGVIVVSPPTSPTTKISTGLLGFVGVTAVAGGVEMILFPDGNVFVKGEWLDALPVGSYRLPGIVLGAGLGLGSLATAFGVHRRPKWPLFRQVEAATGRHWSWAGTGVIGAGLAGWILLEVALIPERSVIEALYGAIAAGLIGLIADPSFRRALRLVDP